MTKGKRRVAVLKDVLAQLKAEKYQATEGTYVRLPASLDRMLQKEVDKQWDMTGYVSQKDGQTCLLKTTKPCKVCAKGAIFLSIVRKENNVRLVDLRSGDVRDETSINLFGEANLDRMEAAFEEWYYKYDDHYSDIIEIGAKLQYKIKRFCEKYPDTTDRLEAIVKNAIKNNGIFKP